MVFDNKALGSHYIVKERPPYKKNFDDKDVCIIANIRIDEDNSRQLYTPDFVVQETYLKDEKSLKLVDDVKENKEFNSIDFRDFDLGGAKLNNAKMEFSTFDNGNLMGVKLKGAKLKGASFVGADLRGADLSGADLEGADLRFCNLEGAKLDGAKLSGALLEGAFLNAAKLANITIDKKTLGDLEALLKMLDDLKAGKLSIKDIPKEWLSYIDLSKLDLSGMDLTGMDLRWLNTVGVDLSSANLTPDQIDGSYMFKSGANHETIVKVARGNTAGLDLTSANLIKEKFEDEKRKKDLRRMIRHAAREEALEVIKEQKNMDKKKNSYVYKKPPVKRILTLKEYPGIDLEERILTMENNQLKNPTSEYDIPLNLRNLDLEKIINEDLMSELRSRTKHEENDELEKENEKDPKNKIKKASLNKEDDKKDDDDDDKAEVTPTKAEGLEIEDEEAFKERSDITNLISKSSRSKMRVRMGKSRSRSK
ncbi:MAG: Serine/threonine-protein kinase B [Alphaproteobacteria bacterium ADurb.Bin438]|nr:MAG: Serine/threonine-protein kinase B [Alphaproteobacteria bacterium ADurb.Bin438]